MFNEAYLKRVDNNAEIDCTRISITSDDSSFSRRITADVPYSEWSKISVINGPVEVEIGANGIIWRAIIQSPSLSRSFGGDSCSFEAFSKTIALAAPAAPKRTGINADASTANQLAVLELDAYGYQVGWEIEDWPIPAGLFSVTGAAPIDAIKALANPVGAFVLPHRTAEAITIRSRYAVLPWGIATANPDIELAIDACKQTGASWVEGSGYNGVYVSGTRYGVNALVRIDGTAGDILADPVAEAILTDPVANRMRGASILADAVTKQSISLTLDVSPEIGIIEPGQIVRVLDDIYPWTAICRSSQVDIQWGTGAALNVTQSITLDRFYV